MSALCHLFTAILGTLLLAGCGDNHPAAPRTSAGHPLPQPPFVASCEPGRSGGELRLALGGNLKTFNPVVASDGTSQELTRILFASLVSMDWATQEVRPALAESWSVAADQKTWTFKLRRGLRWSDGQPLTADDVVFTWNDVIYNPDIPNQFAEPFQPGGKKFSVTKMDDTSVQVFTPEVFAPFLEFFGIVPVLPKHSLSRDVAGKQFSSAFNLGTPPEQLASSGPFRLKKFNYGSSLILERNREYWAVDKTGQRLPYFDFVIYTIIPNSGAGMKLFFDGKTDTYERVRPEEYESFEKAASGGKFQLLNVGAATEKDVFWFNQNTGTNAAGQPLVSPSKLKWFRSTKFRQAIALAINRDRIAQSAYGGRAKPSISFLAEDSKRWTPPAITQTNYNPAKARELLAELGLQDRNGNGFLEDAESNAVEIVFATNLGNPTRFAVGALIVDDLRKLGVKMNYQAMPFPMLAQKINVTGDYECVLLGLGGGGLDPASSLNVLKSSDTMCQWFPSQKTPSTDWEARIDSLLDVQMQTLDPAARKKAFDEIEAILTEQAPMIYTVTPFAYSAVNPGLGNTHPAPAAPSRVTWNVEELYRKK